MQKLNFRLLEYDETITRILATGHFFRKAVD
jgi:hypothetical protein